MLNPLNHPFLVLVVSLAAFWAAARTGAFFHSRQGKSESSPFEDFKLILGSTLTLLALIIGFTFSMAVSRYDQRKNLEEEEANAIGTEYVRADLLPPADAARVQSLLKSYLNQRILYYSTRNAQQLQQIQAETAELQTGMWSAVVGSASGQPTPAMALVVTGMNGVLNSEGYTQAAWWNRIPVAAWTLLITIGIFCNVLIGYVAQGRSGLLLLILPITLSISLFLIADIDTPGRGVIRVHPQNLEHLAMSLHSR
jgi:hypothetical protein